MRAPRKPEYSAWQHMRQRCGLTGDGHLAHKDYAGRGITVCREWASDYGAFLRDMGPRPSPTHTLERKNNDGNYEPNNCVWATRGDQSRNRRVNVKINGKVRSEVSRESGIPYGTLKWRMDAGWPESALLLQPSGRKLKTRMHVGPKICPAGHVVEGINCYRDIRRNIDVCRKCNAEAVRRSKARKLLAIEKTSP